MFISSEFLFSVLKLAYSLSNPLAQQCNRPLYNYNLYSLLLVLPISCFSKNFAMAQKLKMIQ